MAESLEYASQANVKVSFTKNNETDIYFNLYGYLTDEGLTMDITNEYKNSLDLAGSFFGTLQEGIVGVKALGEFGAQKLSPEIKTTIKTWFDTAASFYGGWFGKGISSFSSAMAKLGSTTTGYIDTGFGGGNNIILNAPYYWQGTKPVSFSLSLYQIADTETDVIFGYQRVMEILSPLASEESKKSAQSGNIVGFGQGPGTVDVHYFPINGSWQQDPSGTGTIIFGPCLCTSAKMEIKQPYSKSYLPIIGAYSFQLQTARILDRSLICNLFRGSGGTPLYPWSGNSNQLEK